MKNSAAIALNNVGEIHVGKQTHSKISLMFNELVKYVRRLITFPIIHLNFQ